MNCKSLLLAMAMIAGMAVAGCSHAPDPPPPGAYKGDGDVAPRDLRAAIEPLFDDGRDATSGETRAVVVMHDGEIVAERYAPGFGKDSRLLSWSVAKSVTAVLAGILVADGRLALDEPMPVPAWRNGADPRGAITLRQILNMSDGIAHEEQPYPIERSDTLRMLVGTGSADMAAFAENKPLARAPGSAYAYSTANTVILADILARLLTNDDSPQARRDAMMRFIEQRLMEPARLPSLTPEFDARGTMIAGAVMHMTARDYARFGELLRHRGYAGGRQVVPASWIRFMTAPSPHRAGYGGHLWLNRPGAENNLFVGEAPETLYAAIGLRGQYVIVSPTQHLTIVRLGISSQDQLPALRSRLARIIRLFPGA